MATIKGLKAVIYNREKIKDLSSVVCPPYDVISPAKQEYYHQASPFNLIHIILGKDIPGEDKYLRAGNYFNDWLKNEILIQDQALAIFFYSQEYRIKGEMKTRFGFISLLRLEDTDTAIFKHEHTRLEPKEDRLKLLKQVRANLSPIFSVFLDKKRIIQRIFNKYIKDSEAFIDVRDDEGTVHKLWKIDDPQVLKSIEEALQKENIFIADGHHRYEVACVYRDQMRQEFGEGTGEESYNYALSYFTSTDERGLYIFPIHRLLKLREPLKLKEFIDTLKGYFDVEEVRDKSNFFFLLEKSGRSEHVIGMYKEKRYWLMRLKNVKILDKELADKPKDYRTLDVSILNHLVFKKIFDIENNECLTFSPHPEEFIEDVDSDPLAIAFFLNPVKMQQIIAVALKGERMPPKSTYFYPKVLSGLVINKHEE
jgi:uncharacterized protein (DUF1015 family)